MRFDQVLPPHQLKISLKIPMLLSRRQAVRWPALWHRRSLPVHGIAAAAQRPQHPVRNRHTVDELGTRRAKSREAVAPEKSDVSTRSRTGAGFLALSPQSPHPILLPTTFSMRAIYYPQEVVDCCLRIVIVCHHG